MKLSIIIPAHNEAENIEQVLSGIVDEMLKEKIDYEIIVVDDNSCDATAEIIGKCSTQYSDIKLIRRTPPNGFGRAIRGGLKHAAGEAVAIVMADQSDDPKNIVKCFRKIEEGYDCVFGSRFMKGSIVRDYPLAKLLINRLANNFIRALFLIKHNDTTNAFKFYNIKVIKAIEPLQALYFNIAVEMPLKAIARGFSYAQIPVNWYGRRSGVSKMGIRQMGRKYLFTVLYIWLEKILIKDEIKMGER